MHHTREEAEQIAIHVEMLLDDEMRRHAYADKNAHDLPFQIFRVLGGYRQAPSERDELLAALKAILHGKDTGMFSVTVETEYHEGERNKDRKHRDRVDASQSLWTSARSIVSRIEAAR